MTRWSKSRAAAFIAVAIALAAGVLLPARPTGANPNWAAYDALHGRLLAAGDTIGAGGAARFNTAFFSGPVQIDCAQGAYTLFTHTVAVPPDVLTAAPTGAITLQLTPAPTISSATVGATNFNVCEDTTGTTPGSGEPMDVTSSGSAWTLSLTTPIPSVPGIYSGTLAGSLTIPAGALTMYDPIAGVFGCHLTGPTTTTTIGLTYNTVTNGLTLNAAGMPATSPDCSIGATRLTSGSLKLSPSLSVKY